MQNYLIAPSLLSADFARLGEEAVNVLKAGGDMLHLDVMDNHYVPNLTVGPLVCEALRNYGIKAPIDVHLMTRPVDRLISEFAKAGANHITFHPEASDHVDRSLELIRKHDCKAGLALNPSTTLDCLTYVLDKIDIILIMSVNPGFGGQRFIPNALEKIRHLNQWRSRYNGAFRIEVDGGVDLENTAELAQAGANTFVAGTSIFHTPNPVEATRQMRRLANDAISQRV